MTFARRGEERQQAGLGTGLAFRGCPSGVVIEVETGTTVILPKEIADCGHNSDIREKAVIAQCTP